MVAMVGMLAMTLASGVALADPGSSKGFGQCQGGGDVTHGDNGKHKAIGGGTSNNPHNNDCSICGGSLLRGSSAEGRSLACLALIPLFTNFVEEEFEEVRYPQATPKQQQEYAIGGMHISPLVASMSAKAAEISG